MTRDLPPAPPDDEEEPTGSLRPLGPGPLVTAGLVALVGGWLIRPVALRLDRVVPHVPPVSVAVIFFAAAIVFAAAWVTWRVVHRPGSGAGRRLPAHQMVNRFVLARTCALVGAVVLGGYAGNGISHLGVGETMAQSWWSLAAALGGLGLLVAGLLLERACRVPSAKR